jgi:hypothetical protein
MRPVRLALCLGLLALLAVGAAATASVAAVRGDTPALAVTSAVANATWKQGWLVPGAGIKVQGTVGAPSSLDLILRPVDRPGVVTARVALEVRSAGAFATTIALPARPLPGNYSLRVAGTSGSSQLTAVDRTVTIASPPEGVLDRALVGPTKNGPWLRYDNNSSPVIHGTRSELWTRFIFLAPPKPGKIEIVWKLHWQTVVGKVFKNFNNTIDTFAKTKGGAALPSGTWVVTLKINGRIAKQASVILNHAN